METRIPLPTDNIYKFYALFGLLLFILSFGIAITTTHTTNNLIFQTVVELETINSLPTLSRIEKIKKQVIERKLEIVKSDKEFYEYASYVLVVIGTLMTLFGFDRWHKQIQPVQDEITKLQLEKLRAEVRQLGQGKVPRRAKKI